MARTLSPVQDGLKALRNDGRLRILRWLETPRESFGHQAIGDLDQDGVCVTLIQKKSRLSQSTVSAYLATLHRAGLVTVTRIGQWTYYRRDEAGIRRFLDRLSADLGVRRG